MSLAERYFSFNCFRVTYSRDSQWVMRIEKNNNDFKQPQVSELFPVYGTEEFSFLWFLYF